MSWSEDDWGKPIFPTRFGSPQGHATERKMLESVGGFDGIRTKIRTNPDGSTTILKTRGGMPEFITTPIDAGDSDWEVPYGLVDTAMDTVNRRLHRVVGANGEVRRTAIQDALWWKEAVKEKPPGAYSGLMRNVMQVAYAQMTSQADLTRLTYYDFDFRFSRTHGIAVSPRGKRFVIEVSSSGVFYAPITFRERLTANWQSWQNNHPFKRVSAKAAGRAWAIQRYSKTQRTKIGDVTAYADGLEPLWDGSGWAFDYTGTKFAATVFRRGNPWLESKTIEVTIQFDPKTQLPSGIAEVSSPYTPVANTGGSGTKYTIGRADAFSDALYLGMVPPTRCQPIITPTTPGSPSVPGGSALLDVSGQSNTLWLQDPAPFYSYYVGSQLLTIKAYVYDGGYGPYPETPVPNVPGSVVIGDTTHNSNVTRWPGLSFICDDKVSGEPWNKCLYISYWDGQPKWVSGSRQVPASARVLCSHNGVDNNGIPFSFTQMDTVYFAASEVAEWYGWNYRYEINTEQFILSSADRECAAIVKHNWKREVFSSAQVSGTYIVRRTNNTSTLYLDSAMTKQLPYTDSAPAYQTKTVTVIGDLGVPASSWSWTSDFPPDEFAIPSGAIQPVDSATRTDSECSVVIGDFVDSFTIPSAKTPFDANTYCRMSASSFSGGERRFSREPTGVDDEATGAHTHGVANYPTTLDALNTFIGAF